MIIFNQIFIAKVKMFSQEKLYNKILDVTSQIISLPINYYI